jgi:Protein of unknown function (DUF2721)
MIFFSRGLSFHIFFRKGTGHSEKDTLGPMEMDIEVFSKLLQMSMLPVVLISAASLLLLSITNRLGRTVDRSRGLARELDEMPNAQDAPEQVQILVKRSELLRASASLVAVSILFSSMMILWLFLFVFLTWKTQPLVLTFFLLSILSLSGGLIFFLADISVALKALKLDVKKYLS